MKSKILLIECLSIVLFLVFSNLGYAKQHPNMYINQHEIDVIRTKLNTEPWRTAYNTIIKRANRALNQESLSVTYYGPALRGNDNDYYTMRPYDWSNNLPSPCGSSYCDGYINPLSDRSDYEVAVDLSKAVTALGLGYAFSENSRYAEKAIALINNWCVNPSTKMTPRYTNNQSYIELSISMPGLFYGADLIYNYSGWKAADKASFLQWVDDFLQAAQSWSRDNNFENWRLVTISSGAALTGNQSKLDYAFNRWKTLIPSQVGSDGLMLKEYGRTKSLEYSAFAIDAMVQTAEIARHRGIDLYSFKTKNKGLELVFDFYAPYLANPSKWPYKQVSAYKGLYADIMECAYNWKQKASYLSVINKWGRPSDEICVMNILTLTHAHGAYDWAVWDDDILSEKRGESPADTKTVTIKQNSYEDNLALNQPVMAIGEQVGNEVENVNDGNPTNRWSFKGFNSWMVIDLQDDYSLSQIEILPYCDRAYQYTIEVSDDNAKYTLVVDKTNNRTGGSVLRDAFSPVSARYIKFKVTGAHNYTGGWTSIHEVRVFGE